MSLALLTSRDSESRDYAGQRDCRSKPGAEFNGIVAQRATNSWPNLLADISHMSEIEEAAGACTAI